MTTNVTIENQSVLDIAIKHYGNIDGVFDIIKNNNIGLDKSIEIGTKIIVNPDFKSDVANYFRKQNYDMATGYPESTQNNWILATNFWNDNGIWVDTEHWQD